MSPKKPTEQNQPIPAAEIQPIPPLPIDSWVERIRLMLQHNHAVILTAEPGAGKSTRLPWQLLKTIRGKIIMTEPRRLAALSAASRMALESETVLGSTIGYRVRFENALSRETRLIVMTEALLLKQIMADPLLRDVGLIIFDEFHERSPSVDLALGWIKELQQLDRPDIKLLIMSATLDSQSLSVYLGSAPIIEVPGATFPLEIRYHSKGLARMLDERFWNDTRTAIRNLATENPGDILFFLPGTGEIRRARANLTVMANALGLSIYDLHGQLSLEDQKRVLEAKERKLILATNVAESSITVPGVRIVVDSGLERINEFDIAIGESQLRLQKTSLFSSRQRSGRAARQGPGVALRLWHKTDDRGTVDAKLPSLLREDLAPTLLQLAQLGVSHFASFSWFQTPPANAIDYATRQLLRFELINSQCQITDLGKRVVQAAAEPRWASLFYKAKLTKPMVAHMIAGHEFSRGSENILWEAYVRRPRPSREEVQIVRDLLGPCYLPAAEALDVTQEKELILLFSQFWPERLGVIRPGGHSGLLASGKGVVWPKQVDLSHSNFEYFILVGSRMGPSDLEAHLIFPLSTPLFLETIQNQITSEKVPFINFAESRFQMHLQDYFYSLKIGETRVDSADNQIIWAEAIANPIPALGWFIEKFISLASILERLAFAKIDFSPGEFFRYLNTFEVVWRKVSEDEFVALLFSFLEVNENAFAKSWPQSFTSPAGFHHRIMYSGDQAPSVEVKLQELFGCRVHPMVGEHHLNLILLGPHGRPIQITRDLPRFWQSSYPEIRRELRGRYPKHNWPEEPQTATPGKR